MNVHRIFSNYFDPNRGTHTNWKKASYCTLVIPILAGIGWLLSGVCGGFREDRKIAASHTLAQTKNQSQKAQGIADQVLSVSKDVKLTLWTEDTANKIVKHTLRVEAFDYNDFLQWCSGVTGGKRILFEKTLFPKLKELNGNPLSVSYQRITSIYDISKPVLNPVNVECKKEWYDYADQGAVYVDFANGEVVGGGFKTNGNVHLKKEGSKRINIHELPYGK